MSKRDVYDNRWIRVTHHEVIIPTGGTGVYGTGHYKNWAVGIVPVDDEGHTYLVGQYRFPLEEYSWEIPEGGGTIGVDPRESAIRELKEETGLDASNWQQLLRSDLSTLVSDERATAFLAWGLTRGTASPDSTEQPQLVPAAVERSLPDGRRRSHSGGRTSVSFPPGGSASASAGEIARAVRMMCLPSERATAASRHRTSTMGFGRCIRSGV